MKKEATKLVNTMLWFALIAVSPGTLRADPVVDNSSPSAAKQQNNLSLPMPQLLYPPLKWKRTIGTAQGCLDVCRADPQDPMTMGPLLYAMDLPGERFVAVSPTDKPTDSGSGHNAWDYDAILKEAGFQQNVPIPDKQIVLVGQSADGPNGGTIGYVKRVGPNIRVVLISNDTEDDGDDQKAPGKTGSTTYEVFVSKITPLEQVLKEPQR